MPHIPIYAYTLIDDKVVVYNWTAMYIGNNKYRVFCTNQRNRNYYDIAISYIEDLQYDMINLRIMFISFNNNDELKFINKSLSLLEERLAGEKNELISIKERLATEHYYCNRQTTLGMEIVTSEKIKNISNKIELFNKLKGQYNEHN